MNETPLTKSFSVCSIDRQDLLEFTGCKLEEALSVTNEQMREIAFLIWEYTGNGYDFENDFRQAVSVVRPDIKQQFVPYYDRENDDEETE